MGLVRVDCGSRTSNFAFPVKMDFTKTQCPDSQFKSLSPRRGSHCASGCSPRQRTRDQSRCTTLQAWHDDFEKIRHRKRYPCTGRCMAARSRCRRCRSRCLQVPRSVGLGSGSGSNILPPPLNASCVTRFRQSRLVACTFSGCIGSRLAPLLREPAALR